MTAETRKIRPYDALGVDEPSDAHEFGTSGVDTGPSALAGAAAPFNDNARATETPSSARDETFDDADFDDGFETPVRTRRRGPLVTRWIGFAAQRRRAQARVSRMRDRQA